MKDPMCREGAATVALKNNPEVQRQFHLEGIHRGKCEILTMSGKHEMVSLDGAERITMLIIKEK